MTSPAPHIFEIHLADAAATDALARDLAACLGPGDTILLEGPLGAGKSHLARTVIHTLQAPHGPPEDVPSPTYTLVQTYRAGDLEIHHADLYRLGDPSEVDELGLSDALGRALCLVEWPDRLGDLAPRDALTIRLDHAGSGRIARVSGPGWGDRLRGVAP